jgi:hypothetical protein
MVGGGTDWGNGRKESVKALKRSVTVSLGRFASQTIGGGEGDGNGQASARAARAIRCYLNARGSDGAGWAYPSFLDERRGGEGIRLELRIEDGLWRALEEEAERQHVGVSQMLEHAVLYFAAEVDAGRFVERILDELDEVERA